MSRSPGREGVPVPSAGDTIPCGPARQASSRPPAALIASVAALSAAMLTTELVVTRLFSVLFFYHYSSFAVALAMSGLTFGGLLAARWDVAGLPLELLRSRLAVLALLFGVGLLVPLLPLLVVHVNRMGTPNGWQVLGFSILFVPSLTSAGAFLATSFAHREQWIGWLYASDLLAASAACLLSIWLMRTVQGPAALLAPVLLAGIAAIAARPVRRWLTICALVVSGLAAAGMRLNVTSAGTLLGMKLLEKPMFEQWNEYSRVLVVDIGTTLEYVGFVIDKTAATYLPKIPPRPPGAPIPVQEWWIRDVQNLAYRLGRPLDTTAVIGVGAGRDALAAFAGGARHVDGYELNGIVIDLLRHVRPEINSLAQWPEFSLIHSEARVGIAHAGRRYDVIQASLVDTWAASAAGGLVLSESGLYTREAWRSFLDALSPRGVFTVTRFNVPTAPAEVQRLVALASTALTDRGIPDPAAHVVVVGEERSADTAATYPYRASLLLSIEPFSAGEVERLRGICAAEALSPLALPGTAAEDPVLAGLLDPARRASTIAASPYDISVPTDMRPYFFMQMRPSSALGLGPAAAGYVLEITFKAVNVLMTLVGLAIALAGAVWLIAGWMSRNSELGAQQVTLRRLMSGYFLGIGSGYILVQLGLHQRLILILGHPTYALAIVLCSMLLGTGAGAALAGRLVAGRNMPRAWLAILLAVGALVPLAGAMGRLESIASAAGRGLAAGVITGAVGILLGVAFPLGVRLVAPAGGDAIQRMWAINGAASIAGSALAALSSLAFGCQAVLLLAAGFYLLAFACGWRAWRLPPPAPQASPAAG